MGGLSVTSLVWWGQASSMSCQVDLPCGGHVRGGLRVSSLVRWGQASSMSCLLH